MMKKVGIAVAVSTLALSGMLAGCSSGSEEDEKTLTVWAMGEEGKALPKLVKEYEQANKGVTVKVQAIPWDTAHDKLLTAVASKNGPDVVQMGTSWMPEFVEAGALADMKDYVKKYPELAEDKFYKGSFDTVNLKGSVYGTPWYTDTRVLYYRKDTLEKAGYKEAPKTWEELEAVSAKLSERKGDDMYGITLDTNDQMLSFMFARQNGSELLTDENKPLFNQPEFVESADYLSNYFKEGYAPIDFGMDIVQAFGAKEPNVPMFISGPWMINIINEQMPGIEKQWGTAVLPAKENNISFLGGANLSIFESSKKKDQAAKFISYMSQPETQTKWMEMTKSLPSTKEAWKNETLQNDEKLKTFGEQMENAQPMPLISSWEKVSQTYLQSFEKMYRGKAKVEDEVNVFQKKAETILK
ncbi:extracellular solute-binding protein [Exiguobacterium sp. RIT452]|uniref:ABC transporter substrate-binding protein n=1 Tax=Exiguobacterium undae TaxID=169177 RepID=A0ABX2VBW6_9BACL|nr:MULTISPECIES: sugar ABC transporter substrate-binding protein [Exiguobacterium]OAN15746.1 ABC transporter substrate-binding protein [Exiguobacterium undae]RJP02287.1 extracellular solute-binding protein [Exiguobacterium sp. RIT452]